MISAGLAAALAPVTGELASSEAVGGGSINESCRLTGRDGREWFLKLNDAAYVDMFAAEAAGLEELAAARAVRVPLPLAHGTAQGYAYLLQEYLHLGRSGAGAAAALGRQLAAQHRVTQNRFGWHCDNTIGRTPQTNAWTDNWVAFWSDHRLGFQLELARRNGHDHGLLQRGRALQARLPELLQDHSPSASLLHGDLWGGNWGALADGTPVIFDPAVYYGDRETDLAMTTLFRGYPDEFYAAYQGEWPLASGYEQRFRLYNLYHVLNHLNLFGGAYMGQALDLIDGLLH